jgi:hypothetical protein
MIVIQKIKSKEVFTRNHMLLRVQQWNPNTKILSSIEEIGIDRNGTINDLKIRLAMIYNQMRQEEKEKEGEKDHDHDDDIDEENKKKINDKNDDNNNNNINETMEPLTNDDISFVKPFSYLLKDLENMKKLKWNVFLKNENLLTEAPLRLKDGDLIVFKNKHYNEQIDKNNNSNDSNNNLKNNHHRSEEVGFNIYTPAQQLQREEMKKRENEARAIEENEKLLEIRNRMEARMEEACNESMKQD